MILFYHLTKGVLKIKKEKPIIYYSDELNDEFANDNLNPKIIDENYKYIHKSFFKILTHFFWYRCIAIPLAVIFLKLKYRHKKINYKILKPFKKQTVFLYGNHTNNIADPLLPTIISSPRRVNVLVNPANLNIPFIGKILPSLGAIPLPTTRKAYKNYKESLDFLVSKNRVISIYPEKHIWPFYTKIRPFEVDSFRYAVDYEKATFSFTNIYKKRKYSKNPKMITYIDGPFYPNKDLARKDQIINLREQVYQQMVLRSKENNIELIKYIKLGATTNEK